MHRLFTFIFLFLFASITFAADQNNNEITVFTAKKIITMNPSWPEATAVAVQNGKILSVGSLEDLKPWLDKFPHKIDNTFENKVLLPGFIEAHGHPIIGGTAMTRPLLTYLPVPNPYGPAFPGVKSKKDALEKLGEYAKQMKSADETLVAWGYDTIAFGGEKLTRQELDKISNKQPIIVWDASEHDAYANSAALKKYNITAENTKINGVMLDKNGDLNGQFIGVAAADFLLQKPLTEILTPEGALKNVQFLMDLSRKNGITTTSELAFGMINLELEQSVLNQYFNDPNTPIRAVIVSNAVSMNENKKDQAIDFVKQLEKQSTDKLMFHGVKFFADDAFLSLTMVMENPGYIDGHQGIFNTPPDQMFAVMSPWWNAGFQIHVHSNGNGGNRATIAALDQLMQSKPRADHRFSIEHYGISTPEMARKLKALGGIASVNPTYLYARSEFNAPYIGSDRAYTAAALKTLVDAGVPTSLHSDTPVSAPIPLEEVWIAVNRFGLSGKVRGPAERISLDQALRMITIDAAYAHGLEDKIGSIQAGKFADFAVLEEDPYAVAPEKLKDIKIWGTVFGGKKYPASEIKKPD